MILKYDAAWKSHGGIMQSRGFVKKSFRHECQDMRVLLNGGCDGLEGSAKKKNEN